MPKFDLSGKTKRELEKMLKGIDAEFARREKQNRKDALKAARAAAADFGFVLEDLLSAPKGKAKDRRQSRRPPQPPKFKDPGSGKTWSGRGRKPHWVVDHLERGRDLDALLIGAK